MIPSLKPL